jgi:uncharacterized protein YjiS (DUF1127 family)
MTTQTIRFINGDLASWLRDCGKRLRQHRRNRIDLATLEQMSDHLLKDMGLTRGHLSAAIRQD